MFERLVERHLSQWLHQSHRKPLVLRGARQIGKTTAVRMFGRTFDQFIELNLEHSWDRKLLRDDLPIQKVWDGIVFEKLQGKASHNVLLFIDEIQNSPTAIALLRYFYEELPHIPVIAAGSLLDALFDKEKISFPVGRVQYLFMFPLSFEEFLIATKRPHLLEAFHTIPLPEYAENQMLEAFHQYALIGGMPEAVQCFHEQQERHVLESIYQSILGSYMDDVSKYAKTTKMIQVLRHSIETAPTEAGKRITLQGFGNSSYRSQEVKDALQTLERASLIRLVYPTTQTELPILADYRKSPKLQFVDTGMANYFLGVHRTVLEIEDLHNLYQGRILEHLVGQELQALETLPQNKVCFWVREKKQSQAEVDFVYPYQQSLVPVEVKLGKIGRLRSLHQFVNQSPHGYAVRLYSGKFQLSESVTPDGISYQLLNLPYYLTAKLPEYLEYVFSQR